MDLTMSCSSLSLFFLLSLHINFPMPTSGYFQPFLDCAPSNCGDEEISYPFRHVTQPSYCGYPGYELGCYRDNFTLSMGSLEYQVIHIYWSEQILEVARSDLSKDICLQRYVDTTLNFSLFNYAVTDLNYTLFYNCNSSSTLRPYRFSCPASGDGYFAPNVDHANPLHELCNFSVLVPISSIEVLGLPPPSKGNNDSATISKVLNEGFEITWIATTSQCENCTISGGRCGYGWTRQEFNCFCHDGAYSIACPRSLVPASVPSIPLVPGIVPSSMYAYSHPICGFQFAKVFQREGLLGIPFPLLVNSKTTRSCP
ncbi:LEAF RUST 10 DISEASE-RESISTANCE LOCUS RECEPTOR-LIKE PROTEIN KINASE-like 2.7 [Syzygium oleosum]|uniref:LEAF RUST 10 DISEASE-RESISTANCE LOCUS RECEPTOR-LIKE PROTEIN KINASE-like 2.7 n=1 Tax=Syzygium oleosum TaxID=219896 RepID=UPI0011D21112|nr:LEAF RUST 10 DISEASE-RESISTANCE LOCUS RECEPTOR-LIKE PROTEIN KINASE-like 2.7 [Syzygium oleosum]